MPHPEAISQEDVPLMERTAEAVREHVKGHYRALPDRLYHNLSRMTQPDYRASHFYTVALAVARLPAEQSAALLEFYDEIHEAAHGGGDVLDLAEAIRQKAQADMAEDVYLVEANGDLDDPARLRRLLADARVEAVHSRHMRASISRRLAALAASPRAPRSRTLGRRNGRPAAVAS